MEIDQKAKMEKIKEARKNRKTARIYNSEALDPISDTIAKKFGVTVEQMKSPSRKREVTAARFSAMWMAYYILDQSFAMIGTYFCRDHSSVIHGCNQLENWYDTERMFKKKFNELLPA